MTDLVDIHLTCKLSTMKKQQATNEKKNGFANGASEPDIKSMNVPNDRLILPIGSEKDAFKALSQANDTPLKLE